MAQSVPCYYISYTLSFQLSKNFVMNLSGDEVKHVANYNP